MRLEEELGCVSLNGFGAGVALGRANIRKDETLEGKDMYCHSCPLGQECWFKHRAKVQLMMPKAANLFDKICTKVGQFPAMAAWKKWVQEKNQRLPLQPMSEWDPYTLQMIANLQDGMSWARTGKVENRGRWTLKYPQDAKTLSLS